MNFYPNLALKDTGTILRRNLKKIRIVSVMKNSIKSQTILVSTCMKMVKERTRTMSAVNDERRKILPSKVIWDGTIDRVEVFRNNVEGHYGQIGSGYLFDSSFQEAFSERTVMLIFCMKYFLLPISRRMHAHCMAHYLVHARVV
jgi:hypothetical protein